MKKITQVVISISLLTVLMFEQTVNAVEVLTDTGQRQTVVERTKQYAGSVDAIRVRNEMSAVFKKDLKRGNGSSVTGANAKCGGFTTSVCSVPCCGKTECESVCRGNTTLAHGNTCTSPYRTSRCGMSCCGKQDCDTVCDNYRTSTVSKKNCGGMSKLRPERIAAVLMTVATAAVVERLRLSVLTLVKSLSAVERRTVKMLNATISIQQRLFLEVTLSAAVQRTVTVNTAKVRLLSTARLIPTRRICSAVVRLTVITLNATAT